MESIQMAAQYVASSQAEPLAYARLDVHATAAARTPSVVLVLA